MTASYKLLRSAVLCKTIPRYMFIWVVSPVLHYLEQLSPNQYISLTSWKLLMILALLSGKRGQTLHFLDIRDIQVCAHSVVFRIGDLLKTHKPGTHFRELTLPRCPNKMYMLCTLCRYILVALPHRSYHTIVSHHCTTLSRCIE